MPTVILIRHGRSEANATGMLAGRSPGVNLDETGVQQATHLAERLRGTPFARVVTSPLERCRATARVLTGEPIDDERLIECDYGEWTGRKLDELSDEPLWAEVQQRPAGVTFPGGESMRAMQLRALEAIDEHNAAVGSGATWVAVTHADVIKAIIADALGLHLDHFQRLIIDPGSMSVIHYGTQGPHLWKLNSTGAITLRAGEPEVVVGGGTGRS